LQEIRKVFAKPNAEITESWIIHELLFQRLKRQSWPFGPNDNIAEVL
jgi:hypothetical protein